MADNELYYEDLYDDNDDNTSQEESISLGDAIAKLMDMQEEEKNKSGNPEIDKINKLLKKKYKQLEDYEDEYDFALHDSGYNELKKDAKDAKLCGGIAFGISGVGVIVGTILAFTVGLAALPIAFGIAGGYLLGGVVGLVLHKVFKKNADKALTKYGIDLTKGDRLKSQIKELEQKKSQLLLKEEMEEKTVLQTTTKSNTVSKENTENKEKTIENKESAKNQESISETKENTNTKPQEKNVKSVQTNNKSQNHIHKTVTISHINGSVITK